MVLAAWTCAGSPPATGNPKLSLGVVEQRSLWLDLESPRELEDPGTQEVTRAVRGAGLSPGKATGIIPG